MSTLSILLSHTHEYDQYNYYSYSALPPIDGLAHRNPRAGGSFGTPRTLRCYAQSSITFQIYLLPLTQYMERWVILPI